MALPINRLALATSIALAMVSAGAIASETYEINDEHYLGKAVGTAQARQAATAGATRQVQVDPAVRASRVNAGGSTETAPAVYAPAIDESFSLPGVAPAAVEQQFVVTQDANISAKPGARIPYIIGFAEAPLALYHGGKSTYAAPARQENGRIDVASSEAVAYANALSTLQYERELAMSDLLGRPVNVLHQMQHAFNGIIVELSAEEAEQLVAMGDIALMEPYYEFPLDTDTGPLHIRADVVWENGTGLPGSEGALGEGVVFGIIDSGANVGSPSFAAVDMTGYQHVNPLGAGNYLGTCDEGGIDEGRCNDKMIGGYEFVCSLAPASCTGGNREVPGMRDENGHGTHVGSTVAGNFRTATFEGNEVELSGVAPRGNLVFFDACYTNAAGQGLCPNVSTLASVNQAVADGVVDAISYSIGGGNTPWTDALSLAFLSATEAGIFVSASGGNSGPGAATVGHRQPWVHTIAAAQHGRGAFAKFLTVTGPGTPPPALQSIALAPGVSSVPQEADFPADTPLVVSPGIDSAEDGCAAFSDAELFEDSIAVIRRGTCPFTDKVVNATAAGAIAVVIANNQAGVIAPSAPGTTIPVFGAEQGPSNALRDFAATNPGVTASIPVAASPVANTPDQLAAFSSRGPVQFDLIKPDITGPGVLILAADAGPSPDGFDDLVGLKSGTSMSQPHNAGASGLVRQLQPGWSVAEIKSALMMTAENSVLTENGTTPANPFQGGSGALRVDRAVRAGLVLNETSENFLAANPASGGDPSSLNLASMADSTCFQSCTFTRTFRGVNTATAARMRSTLANRFTVALEGLDGEVNRTSIAVGNNAEVSVTVTIDSTSLPANGQFNFGSLVLTPVASPDSPTLRLPIAVAVPAPVIQVGSAAISVTAGGTGSGQAAVSNTGGGPLDYTVSTTGEAALDFLNQPRLGNTGGTRSGLITTNPPQRFVVADDFSVGGDASVGLLRAEGFTQASAIGIGASAITWYVYADDGGRPLGSPINTVIEPVWTYTSAPNGPGINTVDNTITLDLAAAGQSLDLDAGTYWVVIQSTTATVANNWVWFFSPSPQQGARPHNLDGTGAWVPNTANNGLTLRVAGDIECGASWISSVAPVSGSVAPGTSTQVTVAVNAAGLAAGTYSAVACVDSNDPVRPQAVLPVVLTVN